MTITAISFAESALSDLEAVQEWYAEQGVPAVGDRFLAEIFERIEALSTHPDLGRVVPEFGQAFLRELIHPPFRIVYRREPRRVRVVRIWRSERLLRLPPSTTAQDADQ
jgi:plasmid stabilization system protein ParE